MRMRPLEHGERPPGEGTGEGTGSVSGTTPAGASHVAARVRVLRVASFAVPVACFHRFVGLSSLDVRRGDDMLRGDWITYIAAPNFMRSAPVLDLPIGRVPRYMAPVGTTLGKTDAFPVLAPVYRGLVRVMPDTPIQLVGLLLLAAFIGMFAVVRQFVAGVVGDREDGRGVAAEIVAIAAATLAITLPFFAYRIGHVSLMHQWVVVLALVVALRESANDTTKAVSVGSLAPVLVAAALNPYLAAMVVPICVAPLLPRIAREPAPALAAIAVRGVVAVTAVVVTSLALGYLGGAGRADNVGFGDYTANAAFLFDPNGTSRWFPDLATAVPGHEGFGYVGAATLSVMLSALVLWLVARWRGERVFHDEIVGTPVVGVSLAMAFYAMLPVVTLGTWRIVDLTTASDAIGSLTGIFRTNGRFIWPLLWVLLLLSVGTVVARLRVPVAAGLLVVVAAAQVAEVRPLPRPAPNPAYDEVRLVVDDAAATGVERVEIQPPWVMYECQPQEWGDFDRLGNVVVASAVAGLETNSGYAARGDERLQREICVDDAGAFVLHQYSLEVLYVIPRSSLDEHPDLSCIELPDDAAACRYEGAAG